MSRPRGSKPFMTLPNFAPGGVMNRSKRAFIQRKRQRALLRAALRSASSRRGRRGDGEKKYADGFLNKSTIHQLSDTADDTWADTEKNPSNTGAAYSCMPVPTQGDSYASRDGRKIYVKGLKIKGTIHWGSCTQQTIANCQQQVVRIIIVQDTRTNGVALAGEDVIGPGLDGTGTAMTSGDGGAIALPTNPNGWGRYKILYDKMFVRRAQTANYDGVGFSKEELLQPFKIKLRMNMVQNFLSNTATVASVVDNSLHMLCAASSSTGSQTALSYYARLDFVG